MARSPFWKYRNPVLLLDGRIDVEIHFVKPDPRHEWGWMPMTVAKTDSDAEAVGPDVFERARTDPDLKVQPPPTKQELYDEAVKAFRSKRGHILKTTDWTQLADVPEATREKWAVYRQKLRDLPKAHGYPHTIKWPEKPK